MMFRNTLHSYGVIAIAVHWLMALGICFLFGLGLYMVELTYYDSWYRGSLSLHKSLGLTIGGLLVFRIVWKATNPRPQPIIGQGRLGKLSHQVAVWVHALLYGLMLCLVVSGYLISTADGRSIDVFGLFAVPGAGEIFAQQEDVAGQLHAIFAWTLIVLVLLHVIGALKHHFIDRDDTLVRMLGCKRRRSAG